MNLRRRLIRNQKGLALPLVLILLAIGGLIVVPSLNYASTSLKATSQIQTKAQGIYAADAGIEYTIWELQNAVTPAEALPENINDFHVGIDVVDYGLYTLYMGNFVETSGHFSYLKVYGTLTRIDSDTYQYTITAERNGVPPTIFLDQIGARLPDGYVYEADSAKHFSGNLSTKEPRITETASDYLVNWGDPTRIHEKIDSSNPVVTQSFYITGTADLDGQYTWVVAQPDSIDVVGEISGGLYTINSTATRPSDGATVARIESNVLVMADGAQIISWQIVD